MPSSVLRGAAGRQPSVPASWGAAPGLQQRGMGLAGLRGSRWGPARTLARRSKRVLSPRSHRACAGFPWPHRNGSEPAESSRAGQLFQAVFSNVEETFQASRLPCTRAGKRAVSDGFGRLCPSSFPAKVCAVHGPGSSANLVLWLLKSPFTQG